MRRGRRIIKGYVLYRLLKRTRLFPFIPIAPVALVIGSLVTSIRALARVRRLERRMPAEAV